MLIDSDEVKKEVEKRWFRSKREQTDANVVVSTTNLTVLWRFLRHKANTGIQFSGDPGSVADSANIDKEESILKTISTLPNEGDTSERSKEEEKTSTSVRSLGEPIATGSEQANQDTETNGEKQLPHSLNSRAIPPTSTTTTTFSSFSSPLSVPISATSSNALASSSSSTTALSQIEHWAATPQYEHVEMIRKKRFAEGSSLGENQDTFDEMLGSLNRALEVTIAFLFFRVNGFSVFIFCV